MGAGGLAGIDVDHLVAIKIFALDRTGQLRVMPRSIVDGEEPGWCRNERDDAIAISVEAHDCSGMPPPFGAPDPRLASEVNPES